MKKWRLTISELPPEGKEIECSIQDAQTLDYKEARVIFSRSRDKLPDGDEILFLDETAAEAGTLLCPEPWSVKVLEIKEEEVPDVKVIPQKISLGRMRGTMLETLIRQREDQEKKPE